MDTEWCLIKIKCVVCRGTILLGLDSFTHFNLLLVRASQDWFQAFVYGICTISAVCRGAILLGPWLMYTFHISFGKGISRLIKIIYVQLCWWPFDAFPLYLLLCLNCQVIQTNFANCDEIHLCTQLCLSSLDVFLWKCCHLIFALLLLIANNTIPNHFLFWFDQFLPKTARELRKLGRERGVRYRRRFRISHSMHILKNFLGHFTQLKKAFSLEAISLDPPLG